VEHGCWESGEAVWAGDRENAGGRNVVTWQHRWSKRLAMGRWALTRVNAGVWAIERECGGCYDPAWAWDNEKTGSKTITKKMVTPGCWEWWGRFVQGSHGERGASGAADHV
jgi:hypothetical protein